MQADVFHIRKRSLLTIHSIISAISCFVYVDIVSMLILFTETTSLVNDYII
jgi:hypothetical protein